jgi:hypothetical protein
MFRRTTVLFTLLLLAAAPSLRGHENYRIIGTVAQATADMLDVRQSKDGKIVRMAFVEKSTVTRDKKKVPVSELKPGVHVVVDARGDSLLELDIVEVRIVPPPKAK